MEVRPLHLKLLLVVWLDRLRQMRIVGARANHRQRERGRDADSTVGERQGKSRRLVSIKNSSNRLYGDYRLPRGGTAGAGRAVSPRRTYVAVRMTCRQARYILPTRNSSR